MEHKLIRGGEQYLPFARSCIKRLRATGQAYASEKFVVNGVTIKVWIEPDQDFIEIDGSNVALLMDSGAVALDSSHPFAPGTLYECAGVKAYQASFTNVGTLYKTNPSQIQDGQLAGKLSYGSGFRGAIPVDSTAKSFDAQQIPDPANPGKYMPDPADVALTTKKMAAGQVPASVFTGRTRLYVQSIYGLWLHPDRKTTSYTPAAVYGNSSAPYLQLDNYKHGGDKTAYPQPLNLSTSSGVFFDSVQGRHWLIDAPHNNAQITLYPLVATPEREGLRKYLRDGYKKVLSAEAKTHLEAYILSDALPDRAHAQVVYFNTPGFNTSATAMGYGWHFNWSGTEATIVKIGTFDQGFGQTGMTSTVYTLAIAASHDPDPDKTQTSPPVFTASLTKQGPTNWCGLRTRWVFTQPDFSGGAQDHIIPYPSGLFECNAVPFYAFYDRDTLMLCTTTVANIAAVPDGFSGSRFATGPHDDMVPTLGMSDGFCRTWASQQHWECTISIGGNLFGPVPTDFQTNQVGYTIGGKTGVEPNIVFVTPGDGYFRVGDPIGTSVWVTEYDHGNIGGEQAWLVTSTTEETTSVIDNNGVLICCTPLFDAEAICVMTQWSTTETKVGTQYRKANYNYVYENWVCTPPGFAKDRVYRYTNWGWPGGTLSSTAISVVIPGMPVDKTQLVVRGTGHNATLYIAPFFGDLAQDAVSAYIASISNVSASDSTVALSVSLGVSAGLDAITSTDLALVGWA